MYSLSEIMASKNLVVIGASRNPTKPGAMLLEILRQTGFQGNIAGVNPQGGDIYGVDIFTTINDVPFDIDLAVMIIPPGAIPAATEACARKGVKGIVISSEGFSESGAEGRIYQEEIIKILRSTGMRAFGPNTLGIINTETGLTTSYFASARALRPGSIGFAAQSGIFVGAFMRYLSSFEHLRISKGMGLGNKIDVDESDALNYFSDDEQTQIIGMYLEDIRDGRKFLEAARRAVYKKPVLLMKGGRTAAGSDAIATHTASLAVNDKVLDGALCQSGVLKIGEIEEILAALMGFQWMPLPQGGRIAIVTYSGAQAIMCIDKAIDNGLGLARFQDETRKMLSEVISHDYKSKNPIDIFPDMMVHGFEKTMTRILKALLMDDGVHGVIFISFALFGSDIYRPMVEMIHEYHTKPVFFSLLGDREEVQATGDFFLNHKIPYYLFPEMGIRVMAHMWRYAKFISRMPPLR